VSAVDVWFEKLPDEWRPAANMLRDMLLEASPQMKEEWKYKLPFYSHRRWMCYLSLQKQGLVLGFVEGVRLVDPDRLFASTAHKQIRHYKPPMDPSSVPANTLRGLIQEAIAWNEELEVKRAIKRRNRS
jgi:hypothetical protein